jgi:hypothetical protein
LGVLSGNTFVGRIARNRLDNVIGELGLNVTLQQISADLAVAHAQAVILDMSDTVGVPGLLSPGQVAGYHHEVFATEPRRVSRRLAILGAPSIGRWQSREKLLSLRLLIARDPCVIGDGGEDCGQRPILKLTWAVIVK